MGAEQGSGAAAGNGFRRLVALLLGLATLLVFYPATSNSFVNYDDSHYVTANPDVQKGLCWESVRWAFTTGHAVNWHPVTWLSHMADCQIHGLNPWGHHFTNVLLHAAAAVLVLLALAELTRQWWPSLFTAVIFALHPTRVESVAWASERKDVLSGVFWMLTLYTYARWSRVAHGDRAWRRLWLGLCLGFFCLGLMSKPVLVTLPCVLLLIDLWPLRRFPGEKPARIFLEKVPFFAIVAVSCAVTLVVQRAAMPSLQSVSFGDRIANALISYCRYVGQLFWPTQLCVFYPRPPHWPALQVLGAVLLLSAVTGVVLIQWCRRPYLLVGWLWFLGTLVPMIGLVQVGEQSMADRYTYLPFIGLLMMLSWGAGELVTALRARPFAIAAAAALPIAPCIWLTSRQIAVWKDGVSLFAHAVAVTGGEATSFGGLGKALVTAGELEKGSAYLKKAVSLDPYDPQLRIDYGIALAHLKRMAESAAELKMGIALDPTQAAPFIELGAVLMALDKTQEALPVLREAVRLDPANPRARIYLGDTLITNGQTGEGIEQYEKAVALQGTNADAIFALAAALGGVGRKIEAIKAWESGLVLEPNSAQAHNNLGILLAEAGRVEEAAARFQVALQLDPSFAEAASNLKLIRAKNLKPDDLAAGGK